MAHSIEAEVKAPSVVDHIEDHKIDCNPETNRLALAQNMTMEEFAAAEKKLKRKLDIRLMFPMWLIFVMNYLDRVSLRHRPVLGPTKEQERKSSTDCGTEQHCRSQSCRHCQRPRHDLVRILNRGRDLVRGLRSDATTKQHLPLAKQAVAIHTCGDGLVGSHINMYWYCQDTGTTLCLSILPWIRRSGILP